VIWEGAGDTDPDNKDPAKRNPRRRLPCYQEKAGAQLDSIPCDTWMDYLGVANGGRSAVYVPYPEEELKGLVPQQGTSSVGGSYSGQQGSYYSQAQGQQGESSSDPGYQAYQSQLDYANTPPDQNQYWQDREHPRDVSLHGTTI
jgi:hypothetical protein